MSSVRMNAGPFILRKRIVTFFYRAHMLALLLFVQIACIEGGDDIKVSMAKLDRHEDSEVLSGLKVPNTMSCSSSVEDLAEYESWKRLQELGEVSDTPNGLERTFLSPASQRAMNMIAEWMREAGMYTWFDEAGNVHGRLEGTSGKEEKALLIGSHLDTVRDAGKYDGALGIVVGIAAVKALNLEATSTGIPIEKPVHVVAFSDEEGIRFSTTFLGSRAVVGTLSEKSFTSLDADGKTFLEALNEAGFKGTREALDTARIVDRISAYIEVHIEQGPVLQELHLPAAPVVSISGQTRLLVGIFGVQGHAGTVPMSSRKDAVAAAAEIIHHIEGLCQRSQSSQDTLLVCTVGEVRVWPGASNVISSSTNFSVDIRSKSNTERNLVVQDVIRYVNETCERRKIVCHVDRNHDASAVKCDPDITSGIKRAIINAQSEIEVDERPNNLSSKDVGENLGTRYLVSGAGHDALAIADAIPVGMMFVRCRDGISHSPLESTDPRDVAFAERALFNLLKIYQKEAASLVGVDNRTAFQKIESRFNLA